MNSKDARASRSRNRLLEAGKELLIRNPKASLSEVAVVAGVGRATLYRHFETREELVRTIARECFELTSEVLKPIHNDTKLTSCEKLKSGIAALMPLADSYHFLLSLWDIAENDDAVMLLYSEQVESMNTLIRKAQAEKEIRADLPVEWISSSIDAQIYSAWWLIGEGKITTEQASEYACRMLFEGINA